MFKLCTLNAFNPFAFNPFGIEVCDVEGFCYFWSSKDNSDWNILMFSDVFSWLSVDMEMFINIKDNEGCVQFRQ